jgi:hypothetical protein
VLSFNPVYAVQEKGGSDSGLKCSTTFGSVLTQAYCIPGSEFTFMCKSWCILLRYHLSQKDAPRFRRKQITGYAAVCSCIVAVVLQSPAVMMNRQQVVRMEINSPLKMKLKSLTIFNKFDIRV